MHGNFRRLNVEAGEVFFKARDAFFVRVRAGKVLAGALCNGDKKCFSSRGSAGIEDGLASLWLHEMDAVAGGWILNVDGSGGEKVGGDFPIEFVVGWGTFKPLAGDLRIGGGQWVQAEESFRRAVVPLHDGERFRFSEGFAPAVVEPVGMGVADGRREVFQLLHQALAGGNSLTKNGVD